MAIHADEIERLHQFAMAVMARAAGRQASHFRGILLAMIGGIIWRADPGSIEIKIHADDLADVVLRWASITGYEYACTYNRQSDDIELHDRNRHGSVLHTFSNSMPVTEIERIFSTL
jgi:hypothetical protein